MVYGEHVQEAPVQFAQLLCENLPQKLNTVFYTNSGSEAVEGAMKLAKKASGRYEIVACRNAYHGSTHGAQSLMDNEYFSQAFRPFVPGIKFIDYNNLDSLEVITEKTAAVFIETIQGEAGIRVASKKFMKALRKKCDECGSLLVLDEIQSGFGRTGKLFAFEHYGIVPDVLLIAKAMGAGMPIGAFVGDQKVLNCLSDNPVLGYINTFGGHPVSAAAALEGLHFLLSENLLAEVEKKADLFAQELAHPNVKDIRYKGLMMAFDVGSKQNMEKMVNYAFEKRILMDWFLYDEDSFRIAPPLIIQEDQIRHICSILRKGLDQL
jgi:acetylornithine/succinyldiaminopimelate/putrescine aminotransferase